MEGADITAGGDFLTRNWKAILFIILLFILYRVLNNLFGEGAGEKSRNKFNKKGGLNFNKGKKSGAEMSLSTKEVTAIVKAIWLEWENIISHDSKILAQLKQANTKGDVIVIGETYRKGTGSDLITIMKKRLSDDSQKDIFDYWATLPKK